MELHYLTIRKALSGLKKKKFSSTELTKACLDQIRKYNKKINAFITVDEKGALKQAKKMDSMDNVLPLQGIPISFKDLFVTKSIKTTAGSKVLENYVPQYNATTVKRLKDAGAIIIGKLNEDAWGHGASGENSDFTPAKNPWDKTKVPGGSSSGSAAAVASGMCFMASGTDTGGSVRNPASFCGVVGLKPTYGRVTRYGIVAMASSLDSIGHITRSVWDSAKTLEITAGLDAHDATTIEEEIVKYTKQLEKKRLKMKNIKIGIAREYFIKGVNSEVKKAVLKAISKLEELGAKIENVSLPHTEYGVATYYIIMSSEVSSNLARYDGIRYGHDRSTFAAEAKRRIMLGTYALSSGYYEAYYKKAMQVRTLIKKEFNKVFKKVDVLITPVLPTPAFKLGEKQTPLEMYLADIFTIPSSLAGLPALSVPCGFSSDNLPIGMQVIGPQFSETLLFKVGHSYQQLTDFHKLKPKLSYS